MNANLTIARVLATLPEEHWRHCISVLGRVYHMLDDVLFDASNVHNENATGPIVEEAMARLAPDDVRLWHELMELFKRPIPEPTADFPRVFEALLAGTLPGDRLAERDVATGVYWRLFAFRPGQVIVDAGAHIGHFAGVAAMNVGMTGRVLAFEPGNRNAAHLITLTRHLPNVTVFPIALGAQRGKAEIAMSSASCTNRIGGVYGVTQQVEVFPLDELWPAGLDRCDLIKIDAEGAETDIVRGATKTIEKYRPALVIEVERGYEMKPVIAQLGYKVWGADRVIDQFREAYEPDFGIWWCFPEEASW